MKTFQDYGIDTKGRSTGNFKTTCPKCSATRTNKTDPCLSVDIDKGVWNCFNCGHAGGLPPEGQETMHNRPTINERPQGHVNTQPLTPDALKWLADRGISPETAAAFGLKSCIWTFPKMEGQAPAIAIPFRHDGEIVNWKFRALTGKAFSQSKGGDQILFNLDAVRGSKTVIITEGELDAMALYEAGFANVCSCPAGAAPLKAKDMSGKLEFLDVAADVFDGAERVILAGDADEVGLAWQRAIAEKLGPEKCWQVQWSTECKDANDVLLIHGAKVLRECIELARPLPVQGLATFADHRQAILEYQKNGHTATGLSTGWKSIDSIIRLRKGSLNVLTGYPSSGKSEWLDAVMLNTIKLHGWRWAMFSPENYPPAYHFGKLAEKWLGRPLRPGYADRAMTEGELDAAITELSKSIHLLTFDESPATVDGIISRLRVCVKLHRIDAAIIDPWNELEHVRPAGVSETEHIGQSLTKFRNFARLHEIALWIVAHPAKPMKDTASLPPTAYDISGSANWRNKADVCISAWRELTGDLQNRIQIHLQKVRDKNLGQIGFKELDWQRSTGRFFEVGELPNPPAFTMR